MERHVFLVRGGTQADHWDLTDYLWGAGYVTNFDIGSQPYTSAVTCHSEENREEVRRALQDLLSQRYPQMEVGDPAPLRARVTERQAPASEAALPPSRRRWPWSEWRWPWKHSRS